MVSNNEQGQSTIEFILTFAFGVSLILMVFNSAVNYASGYLIQYATFMASRVYLTADKHTNNPLEGADEKAREAFNIYNLNAFVPNAQFNINPAGDGAGALTVGAYTTFEQSIDVMGRIAGQQRLEMVSESFLGKEPPRAECAKRTCFGITQAETCSRDMDMTLYDNGC